MFVLKKCLKRKDMSFLRKLFGEKKEEETRRGEEYSFLEEFSEADSSLKELPVETEEIVYIKPYELRNLSELSGIIDEVAEGNIVLLDLTPIAKMGGAMLKRAIDRIRGSTLTLGGDIGRINNKLILTPKFVRIWKKRKKTKQVSQLQD